MRIKTVFIIITLAITIVHLSNSSTFMQPKAFCFRGMECKVNR